MKLQIHLSGSMLFETDTDVVPTLGSVVIFRTDGYKKGLHSGSIISVPVTSDDPPEFDFTGSEPIVYLSANGYTVIKEGAAPE